MVIPSNQNFAVWTLADLSIPLPIELAAFKANCNGRKVELGWTTSSEINTDYFGIERSFDGYTFEEIGQVAASGNSNTSTSYTYQDKAGKAYYRLTTYDVDGEFSRSDIVFKDCSNHSSTLSAHPNPSHRFFNLTIPDGAVGDLVVHNALGASVLHTSTSGETNFSLDLGDHPSGVYFVRLITPTERYNVRLIKLE